MLETVLTIHQNLLPFVSVYPFLCPILERHLLLVILFVCKSQQNPIYKISVCPISISHHVALNTPSVETACQQVLLPPGFNLLTRILSRSPIQTSLSLPEQYLLYLSPGAPSSLHYPFMPHAPLNALSLPCNAHPRTTSSF